MNTKKISAEEKIQNKVDNYYIRQICRERFIKEFINEEQNKIYNVFMLFSGYNTDISGACSILNKKMYLRYTNIKKNNFFIDFIKFLKKETNKKLFWYIEYDEAPSCQTIKLFEKYTIEKYEEFLIKIMNNK